MEIPISEAIPLKKGEKQSTFNKSFLSHHPTTCHTHTLPVRNGPQVSFHWVVRNIRAYRHVVLSRPWICWEPSMNQPMVNPKGIIGIQTTNLSLYSWIDVMSVKNILLNFWTTFWISFGNIFKEWKEMESYVKFHSSGVVQCLIITKSQLR